MRVPVLLETCGKDVIERRVSKTLYFLVRCLLVFRSSGSCSPKGISHKLRKRERCQGGVAEHKIVECGDERHTPHSKQEAQKEFGAAYACDSI